MTTTVSQEFIKFNAEHLLAVEIQACVERWMSIPRLSQTHAEELTTIIKQHTNLSLEAVLVESLGICTEVVSYPGHAGTTEDVVGVGLPSAKFKSMLSAEVNLNTLKVTGEFSRFNGRLFIPRWMVELSDTELLSAAEVTAMILHEIGHQFFNIATIGEYVWLNYYLTDGLEVLSGTKPNTYKVEILNAKAYDWSVDEIRALRQTNKAKLRQAVLAEYMADKRHQFKSVAGTLRRNEQLADVFAARLGYSRHLATALYKFSQVAPSHARYHKVHNHHHTRVLKAAFLFLATGVTLVVAGPALPILFATMFAMEKVFAAPSNSRLYDNPHERIVKLKRELIAELKQIKPGQPRYDLIDADIRHIDDLLKSMTANATVVELVAQFFFSYKRRSAQLQRQEETLESLMNNELFVSSHRFAK